MSSPQIRGRQAVTGLVTGAVAMAGFVAVLWLLEGLDQASGNALDGYGIRPRIEDGLLGIVLAPWLHLGWAHLMSNTVPLFVLGVLVMLDGWRTWLTTTVIVVLVSGVTVWLLAPPNSVTIGASGIVFGWLMYLLVRGFYTRSPGQIVLGVLVFLLYGGALWGVLPTAVGVSWQAHLGGAVGGLIAARGRRFVARPVRTGY